MPYTEGAGKYPSRL